MYMRGMENTTCGCKQSGLSGLADQSQSQQQSQSSRNDVATGVTTQISPQISPNFIQQQQPQNSAVNTSTSFNPNQSASGIPGMPGAIPTTGMIPGIDGSAPLYPNYSPTLAPAPNNSHDLLIYGALGAVGIALIAKLAKRNKQAA